MTAASRHGTPLRVDLRKGVEQPSLQRELDLSLSVYRGREAAALVDLATGVSSFFSLFAVSDSTHRRAPHPEQNCASPANRTPHFEQNVPACCPAGVVVVVVVLAGGGAAGAPSAGFRTSVTK